MDTASVRAVQGVMVLRPGVCTVLTFFLFSFVLPAQQDRKAWAQLKSRLTAIFHSKTRDEWCEVMEGSDVCFAPILTMKEASQHPHAKARGAYVDVLGFAQPAPAPRFSRTKEGIQSPAAKRGQHTDEVLQERGFSAKEIDELKAGGVVGAQ